MSQNLNVFGVTMNNVVGVKVKNTSATTIIYTEGGGGSANLQSGNATPTSASQTIYPANGYDGFSSFTVGAIPSNYIVPTGTVNISTNGTTDVSQYASASVSVTPYLQSKTSTPTESQQQITADNGYDGLSQVTVNAIANTYVGSAITRNPALTVSGNTVTAKPGYYSATATASVATATQATPSISVSNSGLITATSIQTTGYVAGGTKTATQQLTTQAATTITPTKSSQTAVAAQRYTTGVVTVGPIPANYIDTTDATASADKILEGYTAYVNTEKITGTRSFQNFYTGTGDPSSSLGSDDDLYLDLG